MISVCIPIHKMKNRDFFLRRAVRSVKSQTHKDYEIVITEEGRMAENTNAAIKKAKGDIIKILYMDDYLAHDNALQRIVDKFKGGWLATGCIHDDGQRLFNTLYPSYNKDIRQGLNTIGSPSVIAFENKDPLLFDERLNWLLDCELYARLFERYGEPTILNEIGVVLGIHEGQMTNILTPEEKQAEYELLK